MYSLENKKNNSMELERDGSGLSTPQLIPSDLSRPGYFYYVNQVTLIFIIMDSIIVSLINPK
jgi:hypothetical protein